MGKDLAGQIPFHEVYIYATVLTEDGKRMSKSLGTGIDPLTVIETKGADALRYSLLSQTGFNQDIRYGDRKAEEARNFCNKIWNAVRFVLMNCEAMPAKPDELEATDQWLLSRLFETEVTVRKAYESYDNQSAAQALYKFFWSELCDWYIEVSKPRLAEEAERAIPQWVLLTCIEAFVTMMHPIMPHITEEVYSHLPLPNKATFLMASSWPQIPTSFHNPTAEASVERLFEITREVRSLRAALDITPGQQLAVAYYEGDLGENASVVASQAWITNLRQGKPTERSVSARCLGVDIYVPLEGISDLGKVIQKLDRDVESATADLAKLEGRLNNPQFVERAKPEVIERDEQLANDLREKIQKLSERRLLFG